VLPKWKQLPAQRQRAIQQRLGVLQNMPESARNRHLNDPNFTRGMNEEDKQLLRDLSHQHVWRGAGAGAGAVAVSLQRSVLSPQFKKKLPQGFLFNRAENL